MTKYPEGKEITIYDIARALHVSTATVSRALKNNPAIPQKTRNKILEKARELGYQPNTFASGLRNNRTNTIGVIVPRLNSMFMSDVIAGIEKVINASGYNLIISQSFESAEKEKDGAETLFRNRVAGLLVSLSYATQSFDHFLPFIKKGIPLIFFDRVEDLEGCPAIVIDNFKAAYEITSHLISRGCRELIHITGNLSRNVYKDRLAGFEKALSDHDLPFGAEKVFVTDLSAEAGKEIANRFIEKQVKADGVFTANDTSAVSFMLELKKHGIRIPEDVSIAGFNNDFISEVVDPALTTIDYRGFDMGQITARTLIQLIDRSRDQEITKSIILRHELLIRNSSLH
jgi:LacI family transcriptional regulator